MIRADRSKISARRSLSLRLSEFSLEALMGGEKRDPERVAARLLGAFRLYLNDKGSGELGWSHPAFLLDKAPRGVELELEVDEALLRKLEAEAKRQGVSVSQIAAHAALYYAAELDAGRLTERVLEGLAEGGGSEGKTQT